MTDNNEQIMIQGKLYNPCNGCELWDGEYCTGDKSYEPNGKIYGIICDRHIAEQFWKVRNELFYRMQECEKLKSQIVADYEYYSQELKTLRNIIENKEKRNARLFVISNNYLKALEEIEELIVPVANKNPVYNCWELLNKCDKCKSKKDCGEQSPYYVAKQILDIINKVKKR